ncbi:MAG: four helix bundle protein [Muribaculaceae bacterium]|nr:four helix bundle protein [Muribaculaceae bacterium]
MLTSDFKDLRIWKQSMDIVSDIYMLLDNLPNFERYALADQIRRSSVSVPSNIAEGQRRNSNKDFIRFLSISRGSLAELETQLLLCIRLSYLEESSVRDILIRMKAVDKMIVSLIMSLGR